MGPPNGPFRDVSGAIREPMQIDDEWRRACRQRMAELGKGGGQHELAEHIGSSQANVSQTLSLTKSQGTSRDAHAISLALDVQLPIAARLYVAARRIAADGSESDLRAAEGIAEAMEAMADRIESAGD